MRATALRAPRRSDWVKLPGKATLSGLISKGACLTEPDLQADVALVEAVLTRERAAVGTFVERATPIVQRRVARWLARQQQSATRDPRQELEDFAQEVFVELFEHDARTLRRWEPQRGLSLNNFIGLVAERVACSILRTGRRHPWREEPRPEDEMPEPAAAIDQPAVIAESQDALQVLLDKLRIAVSPQGWNMFELLYLQDRSVAEVQAAVGLSAAAVHQWRSRLRRLACELHAESTTPADAIGRGEE